MKPHSSHNVHQACPPGRDFPELRLREHGGTYRAEGGVANLLAMASILKAVASSDGLRPKSGGLQLTSDGLHPAVVSNLLAMTFILRAMASNLLAMASI